MDNLVRCKACGYITVSTAVRDVCPACGVPAKMFEPYKDPVSARRRRILDLHTHPVMVHFPQAFALTLFLLGFLVWVFPAEAFKNEIGAAARVLSVLLPFFVIGAVLTGLLDGKLRFRKVTTPMLKKKILLSLIFFVISVFMALGVTLRWEFFQAYPLLSIALALAVTLCGAFLGLIGGKLLNAKFPG